VYTIGMKKMADSVVVGIESLVCCARFDAFKRIDGVGGIFTKVACEI
jgi:hypothetical protein